MATYIRRRGGPYGDRYEDIDPSAAINILDGATIQGFIDQGANIRIIDDTQIDALQALAEEIPNEITSEALATAIKSQKPGDSLIAKQSKARQAASPKSTSPQQTSTSDIFTPWEDRKRSKGDPLYVGREASSWIEHEAQLGKDLNRMYLANEPTRNLEDRAQQAGYTKSEAREQAKKIQGSFNRNETPVTLGIEYGSAPTTAGESISHEAMKRLGFTDVEDLNKGGLVYSTDLAGVHNGSRMLVDDQKMVNKDVLSLGVMSNVELDRDALDFMNSLPQNMSVWEALETIQNESRDGSVFRSRIQNRGPLLNISALEGKLMEAALDGGFARTPGEAYKLQADHKRKDAMIVQQQRYNRESQANDYRKAGLLNPTELRELLKKGSYNPIVPTSMDILDMDELRNKLSNTSLQDLRGTGMRFSAYESPVTGVRANYTKRSALTDRYGRPLTQEIVMQIPQSVLKQSSGRWTDNIQDIDALIRNTASSRRSR